MTQVMKLTTEDDEIYPALTNTRNDLIASFTDQFANVNDPECRTFVENCVGMLQFDQESIDVPYYQEQANPRAPNPRHIQMTANALGSGADMTQRNGQGAAGGGRGRGGFHRDV